MPQRKVSTAQYETPINVASLSVRRQSDITNTTTLGARIETGWGVMAVAVGARVFTETVTFQTSFSALPIVTLTCGGDSTTASTYGSGINAIAQNWATKAVSITAASFVSDLRIADNGTTATAAAAGFVFYQWTAIGN